MSFDARLRKAEAAIQPGQCPGCTVPAGAVLVIVRPGEEPPPCWECGKALPAESILEIEEVCVTRDASGQLVPVSIEDDDRR